MDDTQPRMTWTTDAPTRAGWYWWRDDEFEPDVLYVKEGKGELVVDSEWSEEFDTPVENWGEGRSQWAGPLEVPE